MGWVAIIGVHLVMGSFLTLKWSLSDWKKEIRKGSLKYWIAKGGLQYVSHIRGHENIA